MKKMTGGRKGSVDMKRKFLLSACVIIGILGSVYCSFCQESGKKVLAETIFQNELKMANQKSTAASGSSVEVEKEAIAIWSYDKKTKCLTISGTGRLYDPEKVSEYSDNNWKWGFAAPSYSKKVKSIVIEPGITMIDKGAFGDFESLESVSIPDTVTTIEDYAFYRCKRLKKIILPDGVTKIGQECFWECTSLKKITLGKNVKEIGDRIFYGCKKLKKIVLHTENNFLEMQDQILYSQDGTVLYYSLLNGKAKVQILSGTETVASTAFANNSNLTKIRIPVTVKTIEGGAFYRCANLKKISFEENSQCISMLDYGYYNDGYEDNFGVFQGCEKLKKIILPDSVQYLGNYTFDGCKSLEEIYFGKSFRGFSWYNTIEEIQTDAKKYNVFTQSTIYKNTSLKEYTVSKENLKYTCKEGILYNKKHTKLIMYPPCKKDSIVNVPKGVKTISSEAFYGNKNIQSMIFPEALREIGERTFYNCINLRKVNWPKKLKRIGPSAFQQCTRLESVSVTAKNAVILESAFHGCRSLKEITLGNGIKRIGMSAFYHCTRIKQISIPASVKRIDFLAFGYWYKKTKSFEGDAKIKGFIIYGKKGSVAQKYAKNNKMTFVAR